MTAKLQTELPAGMLFQLSVVLTRLSVAFSRRRVYPASHPLVCLAEDQLFVAITAAFESRPVLSFVVANDDLLVDDNPVGRGSVVVHELVNRLHLRGVGALSFQKSLTPESLHEVVAWLAADDTEAIGSADGATPASNNALNIPGVSISLLQYGELILGSGEDTLLDVQHVWRSLADLALRRASAPERPTDGDGALPGEIVAGIEHQVEQEGFAQQMAFAVMRMTDMAAHSNEAQRARLGEQLCAVMLALRSSSIGALIKAVGASAEQRRFIGQLVDVLPVGAVVQWLDMAGRATGQELSHHLLRLLAKLSARSNEDALPLAEPSALRDAARDLVSGWTLDDPNPTEHRMLLDGITRLNAQGVMGALTDHGAERVVLLGLEVDVFGDDACDAARQLLAEGRVCDLLAFIDGAPGANAAATLRSLIMSDSAIKSVLLRDPLDVPAARALLASLDLTACDALLDVLCDAEARTVRRLVYDRLREFGAPVARKLADRLEGGAWYFVRNLLALLRDIAIAEPGKVDGADVSLLRFVHHQQEQVRLEAVRLLMSETETRAVAIQHALSDSSERVVALAIGALASGEGVDGHGRFPDETAIGVVQLVLLHRHSEALAARAVLALSKAPASRSVRELLLSLATRRTMVLRRMVLADASPLALVALEVLAQRYAQDSRVARVLTLAARHGEERIRHAVRVQRDQQAAQVT